MHVPRLAKPCHASFASQEADLVYVRCIYPYIPLGGLHLALKGADSFTRGVCLTLALVVQIPSSRRPCLRGLDLFLEDPLILKVLIPS